MKWANLRPILCITVVFVPKLSGCTSLKRPPFCSSDVGDCGKIISDRMQTTMDELDDFNNTGGQREQGIILSVTFYFWFRIDPGKAGNDQSR